MKESPFVAGIFLLPLLSVGCSGHNVPDDSNSDRPAEIIKSDFEIACTATGGIHENGRCKCDNVFCDEGDVCNSSSKKCPEKSLPEICAKDSVLCNNSIFYKCNSSNRFVEDLICENGCLPDYSDCAECVNDKCQDGLISKCVGGVFQTMSYCKSGTCKNDTACFRECEEGEQICSDGKIMECRNEEYKEVQTCEYGCDKKQSPICASGCEVGEQLCSGGVVKECNGGKYVNPTPCKNGNSCSSATECGECINNEVYCVDDSSEIGYLRTCRNGKLLEQDDRFVCNGNHSCDASNNRCGICKNGDRRCVNDPETNIGHVEICTAGKYVEEKVCDDSASCKSNTACGDCLNNTQTCVNDDDKLGTLQQCLNGVVINKTCEKNYSCDGDKCGECNDITYRQCSSGNVGMISYCENGKFQLDKCPAEKPYCKPGDSKGCSATKE